MAGDDKQRQRDEALEGVADALQQLGNVSSVDSRHRAAAALLEQAIRAQCDGHEEELFSPDQITVLVRVLGEVVKLHHNGKPKGFWGEQLARYKKEKLGTQWAVGSGVVGIVLTIAGGLLLWAHDGLSDHVDEQVQQMIQAHYEEEEANEAAQKVEETITEPSR